MAVYVVTGAAGFIGSKVADFLLDEGHTVVGIDNLNQFYDLRLKHWRLDRLKGYPGFEFRHLDITDLAGIRALFKSLQWPVDGVFNLAARAGVRQSVEQPWAYMETNAIGTLNLLECCREHGVKKFVLASTSSLYGNDNVMPYREDARTDRSLSPYAASKKAAEALCHTYYYLYGIDVTVLRYFTVYGPAGRPDMSLFRFVQWISEGRPVTVYGDGRQKRDFAYVDDIARGTIAALKPIGFEVVNLGSDRPVVLMDAIRMIEELLGKTATFKFKPAHPADVVATWADISKARELFGWRPQHTVSDGLQKLVAWYKANEVWTASIATD